MASGWVNGSGTYRMVVIFLGTTSLLGVCGITLLSMCHVEPPASLAAAVGTVVGTLSGLLARSPNPDQGPHP